MNRIGLKRASRQCLADANCSPAAVTLVYLLVAVLLAAPILVYLVTLENDFFAATQDADYYTYYYLYMDFAEKSLILKFVLTLLSGLWQTGYRAFCLRLSRRQKAGFRDLLTGLRRAGRVLRMTVFISVFTYLWSLLFVIPGIVAAYRYRMAYYALLDDPTLTAREALAVSKRITQGHKLELLMLDLSFLGWDLLITLTCGIVGIWKLPYIEATYAHAFNWMMQLDRQNDDRPNWY